MGGWIAAPCVRAARSGTLYGTNYHRLALLQPHLQNPTTNPKPPTTNPKPQAWIAPSSSTEHAQHCPGFNIWLWGLGFGVWGLGFGVSSRRERLTSEFPQCGRRLNAVRESFDIWDWELGLGFRV